MLSAAADGKDEARCIGDALLKMASKFAEQLVYGLIANRHHYEMLTYRYRKSMERSRCFRFFATTEITARITEI